MAMLDFLMVSDYLKTTIENSFKDYGFVFQEAVEKNSSMAYKSFDFIFRNNSDINLVVGFQPKDYNGVDINCLFFSVQRFKEKIKINAHISNLDDYLLINTPTDSSFKSFKEKLQENVIYVKSNMADILTGKTWPKELIDNNDLENYR